MWWRYENLESRVPCDWSPATRGDSEWDAIDFHLDLGCGTVPKGRLGIDRHPAPGVDLLMDLNTLMPMQVEVPPQFEGLVNQTIETFNERIRLEQQTAGLPFPTNSIESIVSHHCFEHLFQGFVPLMDECHRVLKPGGILRIITPLFPSRAAVEDPDHKRYIMTGTWETFCGAENGEHWHESFSVPYTTCRFELVDKDYTKRLDDPAEWWGPDDVREIRVALRKYALEVANEENGEVPAREQIAPPAEDEERGTAEAGRDRELAVA